MSVAVTPYAIVLDNVPEWANIFSRSLRSFLPQNTEIITATSPSGALAILREQATRTLTLFASDYHLGPGDAHLPQLLGDIHQSFGDISLPLVAVSGTHANVVTASLLKRGRAPFPFVDKATFALDPSSRHIAQVLTPVITGNQVTEVTTDLLTALSSAAPYTNHITRFVETLDAIKALCVIATTTIQEHYGRTELPDFAHNLIKEISKPFSQTILNEYELHEYKNSLYLLLARLDSAPTEAQDFCKPIISALASAVRDRYESLCKTEHTTDVTDTILSLESALPEAQLKQITLKCDHALFSHGVLAPEAIRSAIQIVLDNALLYSAPNHRVEVKIMGNDLRISNVLAKDSSGFEIKDNQMNRKPYKGTSGSSSGTGLLHLLAIAQQSDGQLTINAGIPDWIQSLPIEDKPFDVIFTFRASDSEALKAKEVHPSAITTSNELQVSPQLSKITVIDHNGESAVQANLGSILGMLPKGFEFAILGQNAINSGWHLDTPWYPDQEEHGLADQLLEKHRLDLSDSCLCLIHAGGIGFVNIASAIRKKYPHVALLPLSSFPDTEFSTQTLNIYNVLESFYALAVHPKELQLYGDSSRGDGGLEGLTTTQLYSRKKIKAFFPSIVQAARHRALKYRENDTATNVG